MSGNGLGLAWLNDTHAMENALVLVFQHWVKDVESFPDLQTTVSQHLDETRRHADMVKECIGGTTSMAKSLRGSLFGAIQAPMTAFARDEGVKNCLMNHAAKQFEVASYAALFAVANEIGDTETARTCRQNMREDEAMAGRIMQSMPMVIAADMRNLGATTGVAAYGSGTSRRWRAAPSSRV